MAEDRADRTGAEPAEPAWAAWHRWLCWCAGLNLPGALLGVVMWGLPAAVAIGLAPALLVGVVTAAVLATPATGSPAPRLVLRSVTAGIVVGTFAVAAVALASLAPWLGPVAVLVGAVTTPPVVGRLRRVLHPAAPAVPVAPALPPSSTATAPSDALFGGPVGQLSGQQLCGVWRHSFVALGCARSSPEVARLVALRQAVLDEIEVRDATALAAWLAAGAGAAEGPDRFLARDDDGRRDVA